jgi:hypothetical protein
MSFLRNFCRRTKLRNGYPASSGFLLIINLIARRVHGDQETAGLPTFGSGAKAATWSLAGSSALVILVALAVVRKITLTEVFRN